MIRPHVKGEKKRNISYTCTCDKPLDYLFNIRSKNNKSSFGLKRFHYECKYTVGYVNLVILEHTFSVYFTSIRVIVCMYIELEFKCYFVHCHAIVIVDNECAPSGRLMDLLELKKK